MNENKYTYPNSSLWRLQHLLPLLSVVLLLMAAGCKQERLPGGRLLKFSFGSTSQPDPDAIREIEVFVFDDREQLIGCTDTKSDGTVSLDYPQTSTLHCIAWGNSKNSSLELPLLQPGDPFDKRYLALKKISSIQGGTQFYNTPPNLFRGAIQLDNNPTPSNRQPVTIPMVMQPTTASIHITIGGLPEATGTETGDYAIVVDGASSRIDFSGNYSGKAVHRLTGSFNTRKEYIIPAFRLFPPAAGKGIRIDVSHDGKLLKSITQTSDGERLLPVAGKALELSIKFTPDGVEVKQPGSDPTDIEVVYPK